MLAYRSGIFPMADSRDDAEIFWIEPRLRAILPLDKFRLSHSLARTLRRGRFTVTCNQAFERVMDECAAPRPVNDASADGAAANSGSWISHRIQASYVNLHFLGRAHSIEVWNQEGELVGGLYGVGFDRAFCGESMFSRESDTSKVALAWLVAALRRAGVTVLDCQFLTPHLESLGAVEIPQKRYLRMLQAAQGPLAYSASGVAESEALGVDDGEAAGDGEAVAADVLALPDAFLALLEAAAEAGLSSSPGKLIAQDLIHTS
ncbi:leucyl/phenylalanyl-tRNA--protein transferase [Novosphingobium sp. Rr 2-17]|nr:leucyl/phenylalanyl-tRNA--protein transferase [Novosphingobium sp. Rr 2-17]